MFNLPSSSNPGQTQGNGSSNQPIIHFEDLNDEDEETIHHHLGVVFKEIQRATTGSYRCWATTIALLGAGRAIQRGESNSFNLWCRYRVVFQALTLVAALGGSLYYNKERQETQRIKEKNEKR
ncbi:hypothetical protein KEM48_009508 [Puccinia striiformis f. sp. tritici PST-130]|nr:hypothetical protein KEM48_009508 [Puccinia striiformis f. sp. tritici PST-130]